MGAGGSQTSTMWCSPLDKQQDDGGRHATNATSPEISVKHMDLVSVAPPVCTHEFEWSLRRKTINDPQSESEVAFRTSGAMLPAVDSTRTS
jgi:hypothetical protein